MQRLRALGVGRLLEVGPRLCGGLWSCIVTWCAMLCCAACPCVALLRGHGCRAGDLGSEMYTIRKGCVAVVGKHRQLMSVLSTGEYFGDIAMFTQAKRTADCVALSHCDLCVLHSYDLKSVMKDFPSSASTLEANAQDQVRQLQVAGRAGFLMEEEENYFENEEEEEEDEEAFFGEGGDSGGSGPPAANGEGSSSTFASSQAPKEGGEGEGGGGTAARPWWGRRAETARTKAL